MKKVLNLLVVSSMIFSALCFTSYGMGLQLEKSLFLSDTTWLNEKIRSEIGEKTYKNGLSKIKKYKNLKADIDHLIAVHYDLEGTLTDSNNNKLSNQDITFAIDGKTYTVKTNANGQATRDRKSVV